MNRATVSALVLHVFLSACDGIGLPVVNERTSGGGDGVRCPIAPPVCESDLGSAPAQLPPPSTPIELASCGGTPNPCAESGPTGNCTLSATLQNETRFHGFACARAEFTAAPFTASARFDDLSLDSAELVLTSDHPVTIDFARAVLSKSRIELRGPITLRILAGSRLSETRIVEAASAVVTPSSRGAALELIETFTDAVVIGELRDRVEVIRSQLNRTQLFAAEVLLDTTTVVDVAVVTPELYAVQVQGRRLSLQAARATMSELTLYNMSVQRCDSMLIAGSNVFESSFGACTDRLRIDRSAIADSVVAGNLDSNVSNWNSSALGVGPLPAAVEMWGGTMINLRLCGASTRVAMGELTTYLCNVCDQLGPPPELNLCLARAVVGKPVEEPRNPLCPPLENLSELSACSPPVVNENPF